MGAIYTHPWIGTPSSFKWIAMDAVYIPTPGLVPPLLLTESQWIMDIPTPGLVPSLLLTESQWMLYPWIGSPLLLTFNFHKSSETICRTASMFVLESPCELLKGQSYTDYDSSESITPNPSTNEVCAKLCKKRREDNPNINGLLWSVDTKQCQCMIGMKGKKKWTGYDICFFGKSSYSLVYLVEGIYKG